MKNKILALGLVLALVAAMVMPMTALAATTAPLSGSFVTGASTPILGTIAATNPMTPQMAWMTITVPVTDASTIANVLSSRPISRPICCSRSKTTDNIMGSSLVATNSG